jgi:hypothetical protein
MFDPGPETLKNSVRKPWRSPGIHFFLVHHLEALEMILSWKQAWFRQWQQLYTCGRTNSGNKMVRVFQQAPAGRP